MLRGLSICSFGLVGKNRDICTKPGSPEQALVLKSRRGYNGPIHGRVSEDGCFLCGDNSRCARWWRALSGCTFLSIKILRNVDNVVRNVSEESDNVRGDLSVLRRKIHEEGMKVKHFTDFLGGVAARQKSRKKVEKIK